MIINKFDIIIVGAGPSGLIAAIESKTTTNIVCVLEKMHNPAMKLKITGKGRCNITNNADLNSFIKKFGKNGRFLKYAFSEFFNTDLIKYFENEGVQFKLERGKRWFPVSDKAIEIASVLLKKAKSKNIKIKTNAEVSAVKQSNKKDFLVTLKDKTTLQTKKLLIATGGKSYPKTGSTGDGYKLASKFGHTITPLSPSLVPLETAGSLAEKLQGLNLKNIKASIICENKKVAEQFGEMLFMDFGVSGPIILTLSQAVIDLLHQKKKIILSIDLKPALDHKKLDQRILREISEHSKQNFKTMLKRLLPQKIIPVFIDLLGIPEDKQLSQINSEERKKIKMLLKEFKLEICGYKSYDEAVVTAGGVSLKEINPQTMESKILPGLYFAGEILDLNGETGGFNLQAAFLNRMDRRTINKIALNNKKTMTLFKLLLLVLSIFVLTSCNQTIFVEKEWQLVGSGFDFPEGPTWHSAGILYVSNCYGNWIAKITKDKIDTLVFNSDSTFQNTNGLFVSANSIYACDFGLGKILKFSQSGKVTEIISGYNEQKFNRPNDLTVLNNGNIYFTDPKSYGKEKLDGRLFFYNAGESKLYLAEDSLAFPNGIAISPLDKKLYVCESAKNQIIRFEIAETGFPKNKQNFIELPGGDPDGLDFDVEGNLYAAHFGTGTVFVISPNGTIIEKIKSPGIKPSNLEFGDSDLKTLYLTEDETNSVYKIHVRIPGYKLNAVKL